MVRGVSMIYIGVDKARFKHIHTAVDGACTGVCGGRVMFLNICKYMWLNNYGQILMYSIRGRVISNLSLAYSCKSYGLKWRRVSIRLECRIAQTVINYRCGNPIGVLSPTQLG